MFKKFHPRDDVSSSTSLKSSVQRNIRSALLTQMPYLGTPSLSSSDAHTSIQQPLVEEESPDGEPVKGGKGKGGKKGGKSKGGKAKKEETAEPAVDDEEEKTVLDDIWPKKEALTLYKCADRISIYTLDTVPTIFQHYDGPYVPTLKLLHKYPDLLPHVGIDRGAIKFLLAGANMMAPGLLSAGGSLPSNLPQDQIVAIHAEGKAHACGIGRLVASSEEIVKAGKGVAVEVICWIGDDLWKIETM